MTQGTWLVLTVGGGLAAFAVAVRLYVVRARRRREPAPREDIYPMF